jgi:hypothetical protein
MVPLSAPAWLPELAEALAQQRQNESGAFVHLPDGFSFSELRQKLSNIAGDDFYSRWLRWFFADRDTRARSPF